MWNKISVEDNPVIGGYVVMTPDCVWKRIPFVGRPRSNCFRTFKSKKHAIDHAQALADMSGTEIEIDLNKNTWKRW